MSADPDSDREVEAVLPLEERLALARQAFEDYRALCFWSWRRDIVIDDAALPAIAAQLRLHGGRRGFLLAAKLCPSPQSRKRFFDFSVSTATPRVT